VTKREKKRNLGHRVVQLVTNHLYEYFVQCARKKKITKVRTKTPVINPKTLLKITMCRAMFVDVGLGPWIGCQM
jgi:acetate kinase